MKAGSQAKVMSKNNSIVKVINAVSDTYLMCDFCWFCSYFRIFTQWFGLGKKFHRCLYTHVESESQRVRLHAHHDCFCKT